MIRRLAWFLAGVAIVWVIALVSVTPAAAQVIFADGFETPGQPGGDPLEPNCTTTRASITDPAQRELFKPPAFVAELLTWDELFPPDKVFPETYGDKIAVGSQTFKQPRLGNAYRVMAGRYISVPFVPQTFGTISTRAATSALDWPLGPYQFRASAKRMRLTISPCYGDFRTSSGGAGDFEAGCRIVARQAEDLHYGGTVCPVIFGQVYWLNIAFSDDFTDPTTSTCAGRWWDGVVDHLCDFGLQ